MPKLTKYPRLRSHVRKGRNGAVYVYWFYDMRPDGKKDIPLGRDREEAIAKWEELHLKKPRIKGRVQEAINDWLEKAWKDYDNEETKRNYLRHITRIGSVFGMMPWNEVTLPLLRKYLTGRRNKKDPSQPAKTQANREMSVFQIVWNYAKIEGFTTLPWPAAGMERSGWKNKETPRRFVVTDALFDAVYAEAEPMLRDCMDLSTATGMRLTDCREVLLPADNILHLDASKTNKRADFDLSLSAVLPELLTRRRKLRTTHLMLLSMPNGQAVTESKLRGAYDRARKKAADKARERGLEALAQDIEAMILRDMRKRASDLAGSLAEASELLQHSSEAVTLAHYRTKATKLRPVR